MDSETTDLVFHRKVPDCDDDFQNELPSQSALLAADDVLAQFLSSDGPLEEPDLNGPTTLHCEICQKRFDNAKKYYGHLRVHSKDNLWICGMKVFIHTNIIYIHVYFYIILISYTYIEKNG